MLTSTKFQSKLEELFKKMSGLNYVILKHDFKNFEKLNSDIDILVYDIKSLVELISYTFCNFKILIRTKSLDHIQVDILSSMELILKFDLHSSIPSFKSLRFKRSFFVYLIENRISLEWRAGVELEVLSRKADALFRYIEYLDTIGLRPDKIKHLNYILDKLDEKEKLQMLDIFYYFTSIPEHDANMKKERPNLISFIIQLYNELGFRKFTVKLYSWLLKKIKRVS